MHPLHVTNIDDLVYSRSIELCLLPVTAVSQLLGPARLAIANGDLLELAGAGTRRTAPGTGRDRPM